MTAKGEAKSLAVEPQKGGHTVPRHVAIIMDGNGRWASARGLPRTEGHRRGVEAVRRITLACDARGIAYLTLFSFSSENWTRPPEEVTYLMGLLRLFVRRDVAELDRQGVRIKVIGAREGLQPDIAASLDEAVLKTKDNTGLVLTLAFNYGGRQEITSAVRAIAEQVARGELDPKTVDSFTVEKNLSTFGMPDPDLLIRTSGEQRISNFLLWQCAYTEFVFAPVLWPDFDEVAFDEALATYASRDRRFGGVKAR